MSSLLLLTQDGLEYLLTKYYHRCVHIRHNSLLRNHRSRRSLEQQRLLSSRRSLCASHRKHRSHIRSPVHHLPITGTLLDWNLPHCWADLVGSCTRQCHTILWVLFQSRRRSQLPYSGDHFHWAHDYSIRRHHSRKQGSFLRSRGVLRDSQHNILCFGHWRTYVFRAQESTHWSFL